MCMYICVCWGENHWEVAVYKSTNTTFKKHKKGNLLSMEWRGKIAKIKEIKAV